MLLKILLRDMPFLQFLHLHGLYNLLHHLLLFYLLHLLELPLHSHKKWHLLQAVSFESGCHTGVLGSAQGVGLEATAICGREGAGVG